MITVSVLLPNGNKINGTISRSQVAGIDKNDAADWLTSAFDFLGCVNPNPTSKMLPRNIVAHVAKTAAENGSLNDPVWKKDFVENCAAFFGRDVVTVSICDMTVTTSEK